MSADTRPVGPPALVGVVGVLGYLAVSLVQAADPLTPADAGFTLRNIPSVVAALLLVGAVVGLARSVAAGTGRAVRMGLAAVALGWVLIAIAQVVSQLRGEDYPPPYIAATVLHVFGMLPAAVAVLRGGVWTGWRRWVPLLCAVYLAAASPFLAMPGTPSFLLGAGWGACWLLLGIVLLGVGRPSPVAAGSRDSGRG